MADIVVRKMTSSLCEQRGIKEPNATTLAVVWGYEGRRTQATHRGFNDPPVSKGSRASRCLAARLPDDPATLSWMFHSIAP